MSPADWLDRVAAWAVELMELLGGPGAGLAIALENVFPPLPSEIILPLAGFTASRGGFTLTAAIAWTTAGSVSGALALYAVGRTVGLDRLRTLAVGLPLIEPADIEQAADWFTRHGRSAVFFGRMVPVVRSLVSIPAGADALPIPTFLVLTALGSLIWNTALVLAGYLLGEQWWRVETYAGVFSRLVLFAAAGWAVIVAIRRVLMNRRRRNE